ncbi:PSD1 and planctomycete cytochrome C domain-containing protein [Verrucomicrobia bacterium]|nr:PSD1 and planctomycete cytochrome C domain-containing protein [Verrucomicrobiota bacterium]MDC0264666.1 PSD1 and planctomycete cytochrome C domain-containing protein [Verrucomicrobiota bacterium]
MKGLLSHMKMTRPEPWILAASMLAAHFGLIHAGEDESVAYFEKHVRPLLVEHCYECHSESEKIKGGLRLDSRQGWITGGDSGKAIEPGAPEKSLLLEAIAYNNPDLEMPPRGKLPTSKIAQIEHWIRMGAADPRDGDVSESADEAIDLDKGRQFWSFRPISLPPAPKNTDKDWAFNLIDRFVMAELEKNSMAPTRDASKAELLRRVSFDLTGLPPSPDQIRSFQKDASEQHYQSIIDQMLASQSFGEKWARHWLDLARYADSTGGGRSSVLSNAWRYRNYVIDAYNQDKPFDLFISEQISGDLMPWSSQEQRNNQLVATAYLAIGPKNLDLQDKELLRMNTVDEQIDTMGRSLLGMTISCARCHDHKFDPIPTEDYYALAGIFRSTRTLIRDNVSKLVEQELEVPFDRKQNYQEYSNKVKQLGNSINILKKIKDASKDQKAELKALEQQLAKVKDTAPAPLPKAITVGVEKDAGDYAVCVRGNVHQLGAKVPRGFLTVALDKNASSPAIPEGETGRLELAQWLTSSDNPLTPRVYVNRVWHHLFGRGIVRSVDNFGTTGDAPTHPELLDYLSYQFVQNNWSTKRLVRELVLSRTYRLSSSGTGANQSRDPDNALRSRMIPRTLPAEAIRDSILIASGQLQGGRITSMLPGAASSDSALRNAKLDYESIVSPRVRSVYIPIFREEGRNALLDNFDFANPSFTVGRRTPGVRPTQSLYLMNNAWIMDQAEFAAAKLLSKKDYSDGERLLHAYMATLSREPSQAEKLIAMDFLTKAEGQHQQRKAWEGIYHALFSCVDFRYIH